MLQPGGLSVKCSGHSACCEGTEETVFLSAAGSSPAPCWLPCQNQLSCSSLPLLRSFDATVSDPCGQLSWPKDPHKATSNISSVAHVIHPTSHHHAVTRLPPIAPRRESDPIHVTCITTHRYKHSILLSVIAVHLIPCLVYKLSFITGVYAQGKT